ncbi:MAG: hydroxyacid dehydrogenase [Nitrospinaceae bacterium]|jgi:phosphoglycerate dehydrogenase-like enzyme|nr:hydroxyacid dehydrogenase [Nitrospinaceae bacterium]MBT3822368.1 hydroxyacid dehydrogenase [Nitrospinaceae bacterium]MBT4430716.1 hydroxyacid dehydrogenase [Nitrospinaceae bacterium]MBT5369786.1 hydroxyacid dehydrogenase [Nitrospinaceae bacterium]MBT6394918.1 hydroxyacid dehydrogenase [Nitrospinaceae bacterium]
MAQKPVALYYRMLKYQPENLKRLDDLFSVIELDDPSEDTPEILSRVEVLFAPLGYFVGKEKMDLAKRLRVIASNTTGHPHIDVDCAVSKGIFVACLKFAPEFLKTITPTAELTWGLILALSRKILTAHESVLAGNWDRRPFGAPGMLSRMSLGVVGLGRLGSLVANYGLAFGMEVRYFDHSEKTIDPRIKRVATLKELVSVSDVISVHIPHEPETEGIFNREIFDSFKQGSYFVNTARGELIDWNALYSSLENGHIAGAALDVFEGEFVPGFIDNFPEHPFLKYAREHDNVIFTPHIGGSTIDAWLETEAHTIDMVVDELSRH